MPVFKCKMCGGTLNITEGKTITICEYCGSTQTIPKLDDEKKLTLFNRAHKLRLENEFDKASCIYESIVVDFPAEAEAYWGLVLCKYGIEYIDDPKTAKKVPTCHRTVTHSVINDNNFELAIKYCDKTAKSLYYQEAKAIDVIQKRIFAIVNREKPYDIFICYKEIDEIYSNRTEDSGIAQDIYTELTAKGYRVFFSRVTLRNKAGIDYEPYIYSALVTSKVMLVIGTKNNYYEAVWVKNEWSRFLSMMHSDTTKHLIPCYKNIDAYDLPKEFRNLQALSMDSITFYKDLILSIEAFISLQKDNNGFQLNTVNSLIEPLLKHAYKFLATGNFIKADNFGDKVLDFDPECAEAYYIKLMAELHIKSPEELANVSEPFNKSDNYQKAIRFGDEKLSSTLQNYIFNIIYNNAKTIMQKAKTEYELFDVANEFRGISNFKNANDLAEQCSEKAKQLKQERLAQEEMERLDAERKAEEYRISVEKAIKKRRKTIAIGVPTSCACIAFFIILITIIIPTFKYKSAMELYNAKKHTEAIVAFEKLNGYKDSKNKINDCKYNIAMEMLQNGKIVEAYDSLITLNGYKDSMDRAKKIFMQYKVEKIKMAEVGDTLLFGGYEQDSDTSNGKENIEWLVIAKENNKILVTSDKVLDCQQYNTNDSYITWESCSLRKWMNESFLNDAFSTEEQSMIQNTKVFPDNNPQYNTNAGNITTDKIFLLSISEVNKYFLSDEAKKCTTTKYANEKGSNHNFYTLFRNNNECIWWLRSPGLTQHDASVVRSDGTISYDGNYVDNYEWIRPALWINIEF